MNYRFESIWMLETSIDDAFGVLLDAGETAGTRRVEYAVIERGGPDGVGRRSRYRVHSPLLYTMEFTAEATEVDPPHRLHSVVHGELTGTGTYHLNEQNGITRIRFDWNVRTTKRWMNLLGPLGRPLFVWAHHRIMDELIDAMASALNTEVLSSHSRLLK